MAKGGLTYVLVAPCVPLGGRETYTYYAHAGQDVAIGQVVSIPFGRRVIDGVVVQTGIKRPAYPTKPIAALRDIVLTPQQMDYASWMSALAHGSLGYTLRLFIP